MRNLSSILITGGCGFIGTNFIRTLFEKTPDFRGAVVNLDALTYAGCGQNLADIAQKYAARYTFIHGDIKNRALLAQIFSEHNIDTVVHFAAESHVDRSILGPQAFIETNVNGTFALLDAARAAWQTGGGMNAGGRDDVLFHHISTDEVYGSLGDTGYFTEETAYDPRSPYSASKAASDHLVSAYHHTYGLPVTISNCSNNYGPYQFPEKLLPLMILNIMEEKPLPVYGDGKNIRDWIYVEDHNNAVWHILKGGRAGETYNIGGENEWENIKLLHELIRIVCAKAGLNSGNVSKLITFVADRPGHDRRYAIDCSKIKRDLGWKRAVSFEEGLAQTVDWYLSHPEWIAAIRSGEYKNWIAQNYAGR